jgi:hypothetical protein
MTTALNTTIQPGSPACWSGGAFSAQLLRVAVDDQSMPLACELSPCHNWCDRCCELCPLEPGCPVSRPTGTLEEMLAKAHSMLEKICVENGISLDNLPPPAAPGIDAVLLRDTAMAHAMALAELGLTGAGMLLAGKVVRVASYLDDERGDDVWEADAVPNLLLLEKLLVDLDADVAGRRPRAPQPLVVRVEKSGELLRGLLAPLFATIPVVTRQVLAALIAAKCAPSPFVRLGPRGIRGDRAQVS